MNKYRKDYVPDFKVTDKGKVINELSYTGDYYGFYLSGAEYKKMRITILAVLAVNSLFFAAAGFLNTNGSFCIYVLIPYLWILLPLIFLIRGYVKIPKESQPMEYVIYDKCYNRVKFSVVGIIMTSMTAVIGDIVFIIRNANEIALLKEVSFCIANIGIALISFLLLLYHNRIVCEKL